MEKSLIRLKESIDKNLNEFVKWVGVIGFYGFYRMMATTIDDAKLNFLILPLIIGATLFLVIDWIIDSFISMAQILKGSQAKYPIKAILSSLLLISAFISAILFYSTSAFIFINLGIFSIIGIAIISNLWPINKNRSIPSWVVLFSLALLLLGITGLIHSFLKEGNAINALSFSFYALFLVYYFTINSFYRKKSLGESKKE